MVWTPQLEDDFFLFHGKSDLTLLTFYIKMMFMSKMQLILLKNYMKLLSCPLYDSEHADLIPLSYSKLAKSSLSSTTIVSSYKRLNLCKPFGCFRYMILNLKIFI